MTTAEAILAYGKNQPEGTILTAKGLLHLGARAAIDQALSRLARNGDLLRVGRGAYAVPVEGRFGTRPPSPVKVVEHLSSITGDVVASNGAMAANSFGLTTQVPIRPVYVTSGRSKRLSLGRQTLEIRHVPRWQMVMAGRAAGEAIRALAWLGPRHAGEAVAKIRHALPSSEWQALTSVRSELPTWMAEAVSTAMTDG